MPLCYGTFRSLARSAMLLLSILGFFVAVAFDQDFNSSRIADLRIVVSDPAGARILRAKSTFKGEKTVTATTGEDGSIRMQIPYGSYSVTISRPGFKTGKITGLAIQTTNPPDLEVVLQVGPCCDEPPLGQDVGPYLIASDFPNVIETVRVPDAATAVHIAERALAEAYGKRQIDHERPLTAVLDDGIWTVHGTLRCPDRVGTITCELGKCVGGVASLKLRQSDGKILSISHTK